MKYPVGKKHDTFWTENNGSWSGLLLIYILSYLVVCSAIITKKKEESNPLNFR